MTNGYGREIIEEIGNFARNNQEDYTRMIRIFFKKNDIRNRNSNDLVTVANSVKCGVFLSNNSVQKVQVEIRLSMQKNFGRCDIQVPSEALLFSMPYSYL